MRIARKTTWVVVADGAKARVLLSNGPEKGFSELKSLSAESGRQATRDQGSDRPGRERSIGSATRHALDHRVDWKEQAKTAFLNAVSDYINTAAHSGKFDELVVAAPSKALAVLRDGFSKAAQAKLIHETAKDLTNISIHDLPRHFDGIVRC